MIDRKLCVMLYENGHTLTKIGSILGVSRQRIHQVIQNYKNFGKKRFNNYEKKVLFKKNVCGICRNPAIAYHHKDRNNSNESLDNLLPVCKKCHGELHSNKKIGKWSDKFTECILCLSTNNRHVGKGLCKKCWDKQYYINHRDEYLSRYYRK